MTLCSLFLLSWLSWCAPQPVTTDFLIQGNTFFYAYPPDALTRPTRCDDWYEMPDSKGAQPYRKWKSYAIYQTEMLREACLAWYLMQQPKNHGLLLSHGAPNF